MGKKDDKPIGTVHSLEDYRPVVDVHKRPVVDATVRDDLCRNFLQLDMEDDMTATVFDEQDIHSVTDLVQIQPTPHGHAHDWVLIDTTLCCCNTLAMTPKQVLSMISALQAAYNVMKK